MSLLRTQSGTDDLPTCGKQATLFGVFSRQPVSKAEAEHYADDLGENGKLNAEDFSYSIEATGVKEGVQNSVST